MTISICEEENGLRRFTGKGEVAEVDGCSSS